MENFKKGKVIKAQTGVKLTNKADYYNGVFSKNLDHILKGLRENADYYGWLNDMQDLHSSIHTSAGNFTDTAYKNDSVKNYQDAYKSGYNNEFKNNPYGYNSLGIQNAINQGMFDLSGSQRTSGDYTDQFTSDGLFSNITDFRRLLGRKGDFNAIQLNDITDKFKQAGYDFILDTNNYYKLKPIEQNNTLDKKPEELKEPIEETPQDHKHSFINPVSQSSTKSPNQFGNFLSQLAPDLIGAGRLFGSLRTNNKVAETVRKSLTPVLKNTHELYSPVTGAFSEMQLRNRQAADIRRQAARPFTSDASLQLAGALEANRQATDLERQGFLADDAEIKRTKAEALRRQEDNIARRSEVANFNRASINQTNRELAQLEAARLKQNWQSVDNFLTGIEGRVRQRAEADRERRNNFRLQTAQQDIDDQYYDALQKAQDAATKWQKSPENASKTLSEMPNYFQFLRELSRWKNANYLGAHANVYGYRYDNKYLNKSAKDIGSEYRFYKNGGGFESLFTTHVPVQTEVPRQTSESRGSSGVSQSSTEKGKLTEKDLFEMIKDINGLPNEMSNIITNLVNTFQISNLTGVDLGDLATTYLQNLYQIKIAAQNKKRYDDVLLKASKNGSLAEPAISMDGKLIVQNRDGSIGTVSLDTYNTNREEYADRILTVSNLANMRKYDPQLANNQSIFEVIDNSMGYEAFQELLSKATQSLGSSELIRNGMFSVEGKALRGLSLLQSLREDDRLRAYGSITAEGLYDYKIIDKDQLKQINALTSYITATLPDRAKTWAAIKTEQTDKNKATKELVFTYLLGRSQDAHSFDVQYKGSMDKVQSETSSSRDSQEDPKKGFWSQVQSGQGGEDFRFTLLTKKGSMSIDGKFYGTTPGLDSNKSLGDYINNSKVGYLIKNNKNITFGDKKISVDSFNDVMVNAYSGAAVVTLPIKADGTVDLNIAERWTNVLDQLEDSGLNPNTPEYNQKQKQLLAQNQLDGLIDSNGNLNRNRFGQFLVLEGYTSEKANAVQDNKKVSFKDVQSDFILPAGDDGELYNMIKQGLSNKDRGKYEISDGWLFNDELFKGNVYIPLNTNPINGYNADSNQIKESTSYLYEKAQQQYSTNSSDL